MTHHLLFNNLVKAFQRRQIGHFNAWVFQLVASVEAQMKCNCQITRLVMWTCFFLLRQTESRSHEPTTNPSSAVADFTTDIETIYSRIKLFSELIPEPVGTSEWHHCDIIPAGVQKGSIWNTERCCDYECRLCCHGDRRPPLPSPSTRRTSWYFGVTMEGHFLSLETHQTQSTEGLCNNRLYWIYSFTLYEIWDPNRMM